MTKQSLRNQFYMYMMSNNTNTVIYAGVTNNLQRRIAEHREGIGSSFVKKYRVNKLVYYEQFTAAYDAISREKQIKAGPRKRKEALIQSMNPDWKGINVD